MCLNSCFEFGLVVENLCLKGYKMALNTKNSGLTLNFWQILLKIHALCLVAFLQSVIIAKFAR